MRRGRLGKGLARRVQVEPELVVLADLGITLQFVEGLHPGHGARPQAVHHHHRDLSPLIRLHHVESRDLLEALGKEESERVESLEDRVAEKIGQRRRDIAFQRDVVFGQPHDRFLDRVIQLERIRGRGGVRIGLPSARPQKGRHRKAQPPGVVLLDLGRRRSRAPHGNQRHAQPVRHVHVLESGDLVIGDELEPFEILGLPG